MLICKKRSKNIFIYLFFGTFSIDFCVNTRNIKKHHEFIYVEPNAIRKILMRMDVIFLLHDHYGLYLWNLSTPIKNTKTRKIDTRQIYSAYKIEHELQSSTIKNKKLLFSRKLKPKFQPWRGKLKIHILL